MANELIPTTILTGFLGSGKTTLLNKILKGDHGLKIAVIENEFGEEGIDNDLLMQGDEQIVEMNNGCICCTVRGDLVRILLDLKARRDAGDIHFDRVVIETTGLADPGPVAQTFFMDDEVAQSYMLDAIISTAQQTHDQVTRIRTLMEEVRQRVQQEAPSIYSKDLIEVIFRHPYTKIQFLVDAGLAQRQTASSYLQKLATLGVLRPEKQGRETYYINDALFAELAH